MTSFTVKNLLGVHALVWAGATSPAEITAAVTQSRSAGYDLLELSLHELDGLDVATARAELEAAGLDIVCSRGLPMDVDVSSDDPAVVARGATLLQESVAATAALGGRLFTGALYSALGKFPRALTAAGRANAIAVVRDLAAQADAEGLALGLEVCNRYETNVLNTAEQALRFADDVGADNIGVHLDTYHMNIEEDDLVRPVRLVGERLIYVHVGENHRGYLGAGHIDFRAFFHALADIGYAGAVTFESFSSGVIAPRLSDDLAVWRNLWDDGFDLAVHARSYMRDQIAAAHRSTRE